MAYNFFFWLLAYFWKKTQQRWYQNLKAMMLSLSAAKTRSRLAYQIPQKKIIIFPGDNSQISSSADAILLLSLISGRNPDLLIGKHIQSSYVLKKSGISILPTGYILVDGGISTSVQYISNTKPIPADKFHIAASTALAGEQLGLKFTYLDAGSGALNPVSMKMISSVRKEISCPIIVGGGIKSYEQLENAWLSGADIVVVGNAIEKNSALIQQLDSRIKCNWYYLQATISLEVKFTL